MSETKNSKVYENGKFWVITYKDVGLTLVTTFKSFIRAKSRELARSIFETKIKTQEPDSKILLVRIDMVHKKLHKTRNNRLSLAEWEAFRKLSFPNTVNSLFKIEINSISRREHDSSRRKFKATLKGNKNGFGRKLGENSYSYKNLKGKSLPKELRPYYKYKGRWIKLSEEEREKEKQTLIDLLESCNGNQSLVARKINKSRNYVMSQMRRFPEVDWNKFRI